MNRISSSLALALALVVTGTAHAADEIHWTLTGQTSVTFDWRGSESLIRYGLTPSYGQSVTAATPSPLPFSSAGPFWEAPITGLQPDQLYHYSIGTGPDHTFHTARAPGASNFSVYVEGDIGSTATSTYWRVGPVQSLIATGQPQFALLVGDLTYGNAHGPDDVDQHFNDVMVWSQDAAYMPAWGNHEYENDTYVDDLRNYKGRFDLPNAHASPGVAATSCCGEDWYWFDYGNVRFIAYPEPTSGAWAEWFPHADSLMSVAQADPNISFIVTFGHRPAFSTGNHPGSPSLQTYLGQLGTKYAKYKLNLNGHSHDYERSYPQNGVVHITSGGGGATLEEASGTCLWAGGCPPPAWSAFRAYHHGAVRLTFSQDAIKVEAICGPAGDTGANKNDVTCVQGSVYDSVTIKVDTPIAHIDTPTTDATIEPGQAVNFTGTASDDDGDMPFSYLWDFGGGAPNSTVEDPGNVVFNTPGVYNVRFSATDVSGEVDLTPDTRVITVGSANIPPDGQILEPAGPVTIQKGQSVMFRGHATDANDSTFTYAWNFDDGAPNVNVQDPGLVRFDIIGSFIVQFIVTDSHGLSDPTPAEVEITVTPPPNVAPSGDIVSPAADVSIVAGQSVNFQGTGADPDNNLPLTYAWDFGGASPGSGLQNPGPIVFTTAGSYSVSFTVIDALGLPDPTPATRTITVTAPVNRAPDGTIVAPAADVSIAAGDSVTFTGAAADSDGDALTYLWNFGGGPANATVLSPGWVRFPTAGTFAVTFTVTDSHGLADPTPATRTITVQGANQLPIAALNVAPATGNAPLVTIDDASASLDPDGSLVSYTFDFGDGSPPQTDTTASVPHTYVAGSYTAKVTVTDNHGATRTATQPVIVASVIPGVNFATNSSVETALTGWIANGGSTLTRDPGGFDGAWCMKAIGPATATSHGVNDSPNWVKQIPTSHVGLPYRFSAWVRSPHNTGLGKIQVREFLGSQRIGPATFSTPVPLTPTWQLVTVDHYAQQSGTTLDFQVLDYAVAPSETLFVDNISIKAIGATTGVDPFAGTTEFAALMTPNPLHGGGEIHMVLPRAGFARVDVLDLSGRRVRTLLDERDLSPGSRSVAFDGHNTGGMPLASGVYFYRVETASGTITHRFAILR